MRKFVAFVCSAACGLVLAAAGVANAAEVDDLVDQLKSEQAEQRAAAADALGKMGTKDPKAVKALAQAVTDESAEVQRAAIRALRKIEADPKVVMPLVADALGSADPAVAISAVDILAEAGKRVVPNAVKALKNEKARYWAILVLQQVGADAAEAVPALVDVAKTEQQPEVRREAVIALAEIGAAAKEAVPELIELVKTDEDPAIVLAATFALGSIGPAAKAALPELTSALESREDFLRVVSAWAVAKLREQDEATMKRVVPILVRGLIDRNERGVRIAAAKAIVDLRPDHAILLPELKDVISSASPEMLRDSVSAVASLGDKAVPGLIRMLRYESVRPLAAATLAQIGSSAAPAAPALAKALPGSGVEAQREILLALGAIGSEAKEAVPAVKKLLDASDPQVRYGAVYALGKIGPASKPAVERLQANLTSEDAFYRLTSAWALTRIVPEQEGVAKQVTPILVEGLQHERPFVRVEAAKGLGHLGSKAEEAVPALQELADDPVEEVRQAAREAIGKISAS